MQDTRRGGFPHRHRTRRPRSTGHPNIPVSGGPDGPVDPLFVQGKPAEIGGYYQPDPALAAGLNVHAGRVTHRSVSEAHGLEYTDRTELMTAA